MKQILFWLAVLSTILLLTGCDFPDSADMWGVADAKGFLHGILHGFLAPLTFLASFFWEHLDMYAVNNNGQWYDFGFLLGIGGFSGGIFRSSRKRK